MSIIFEKENQELVLCYSPEFGIAELSRKLFDGENILIKRTFWVNQSHLRNCREGDEETLRFCIGCVGDTYTLLNSDVINTTHRFFFSNEINLKQTLFIAYRNISILKKIDEVIESDFYVGGNWDVVGGIPYEAYLEMLMSFPKTAELDKYAHCRIASCIKEYFPECDKYQYIYEQFIERRSRTHKTANLNVEIELAQFSATLNELRSLINRSEGIGETEWQIRINDILRLLYPKYILCAREISFKGIDGYDKRPDFVLVDASGFVDILEIKKPDVQILTKQASYRNNYVPVREFSGAIQQLEKYILCLTTDKESRAVVESKLKARLPASVSLGFVNPQGYLIAGRSRDFNKQQTMDFELIKRQYKHIVDIMTYDDLIGRFETVVRSLKDRVECKGTPPESFATRQS